MKLYIFKKTVLYIRLDILPCCNYKLISGLWLWLSVFYFFFLVITKLFYAENGL